MSIKHMPGRGKKIQEAFNKRNAKHSTKIFKQVIALGHTLNDSDESRWSNNFKMAFTAFMYSQFGMAPPNIAKETLQSYVDQWEHSYMPYYTYQQEQDALWVEGGNSGLQFEMEFTENN